MPNFILRLKSWYPSGPFGIQRSQNICQFTSRRIKTNDEKYPAFDVNIYCVFSCVCDIQVYQSAYLINVSQLQISLFCSFVWWKIISKVQFVLRHSDNTVAHTWQIKGCWRWRKFFEKKHRGKDMYFAMLLPHGMQNRWP